MIILSFYKHECTGFESIKIESPIGTMWECSKCGRRGASAALDTYFCGESTYDRQTIWNHHKES